MIGAEGECVKVDIAVLRTVEMPLKFRFKTSFGETNVKKFLLLELRADGLAGWGECVAEENPFYSPETLNTASAVVENVRKHVAEGYRRIKLKIEPGCDVERLQAVREAFPSIVLTVDANAAYTLDDTPTLAALDAFGLDYMEQPLHHEDITGHAELARRIKTPICLDESIRSAADAKAAIALRACKVINVKIGRVGGHGEALAIHELASAAGIPLWCGGMLEAGIGRAHNVAIASLAGFSKPGDTSSSSRYFEEDVVEPRLEASNGLMPVPTGPGTGVEVRAGILSRFTKEKREYRT